MLKRAASGGRLPHAYLFCGLEGSGRRTAARMLAAALSCAAPEAGEACGRCPSCGKLARDTHPDLILVEPEAEARKKGLAGAGGDEEPEGGAKKDEAGVSGRKGLLIKIDQVKRLCRRLSFPPVEGRMRVGVIWPAGSLREEAANALLKTLEEPPAGNLLILCCREPGDVLPTIASRCQAVGFAPLPQDVVRDWLLAQGAGEEAALQLAYLSGGSLSRAARWLEPRLWERRRGLLEGCARLEGAAAAQAMELAAGLWPPPRGEDKTAAMAALMDLLGALKSFWRDALVIAATGEAGRVVNRDFREALAALAAGRGPAELLRPLAEVERAQAAIEANCDAQLALEVMFLALSRPPQGGLEGYV